MVFVEEDDAKLVTQGARHLRHSAREVGGLLDEIAVGKMGTRTIGFTGGEIPTVKVNRLLLNNISVVGVGWGAYWLARPEFLQEQWQVITPMLADGLLSPLVGSVYDLDDVATALTDLDERRALGKVLLRVR